MMQGQQLIFQGPSKIYALSHMEPISLLWSTCCPVFIYFNEKGLHATDYHVYCYLYRSELIVIHARLNLRWNLAVLTIEYWLVRQKSSQASKSSLIDLTREKRDDLFTRQLKKIVLVQYLDHQIAINGQDRAVIALLQPPFLLPAHDVFLPTPPITASRTATPLAVPPPTSQWCCQLRTRTNQPSFSPPSGMSHLTWQRHPRLL